MSSIQPPSLWDDCLKQLKQQISAQQFSTWLRPLHAEINAKQLILLAPNQFVVGHVNEHFLNQIVATIVQLSKEPLEVVLRVGTKEGAAVAVADQSPKRQQTGFNNNFNDNDSGSAAFVSNTNPNFTFDNFVEGKSNQLARAAAMQAAENPGTAYNPLFIYGGVGLGKTHLMHAIGNRVLQHKPNAKILYLHSERFVADMIKALQRNAMNDFKRYYRGLNVLLIDDIQFFAGKDRSQEEFFHTFNTLFDSQQQIVLTCDRYPKEIDGLEERLKSRFGWGLTSAIEPPELETRVAILMSKAEQLNVDLNEKVAFFIAKNVQSNVRELEGALKRVVASAHFMRQAISIDFARETLKDLLVLQAKLITIENIQKTVADYYKIKVSDLLSKRRSRSLSRPRQIAMALSRELTDRSLPEIADYFGGRDHTTVMHACRKVKELLADSLDIQEDYKNLMRILSA